MKISLALLFAITFSTLPVLALAASAKEPCDYAELKKNKTPLKDMLVRSVESNCSELMSAILKNEKEDEIFNAAGSFTIEINAHLLSLAPTVKGKKEGDPEAAPFMEKMKALGFFGSFLQTKCPDDKGEGKACAARKDIAKNLNPFLTKMNQAVAEEQAEEDKNGAADDLKAEICANQIRIEKLQANIRSEKEIGKESGVVDLNVLHGSATGISISKQRIEELKREYRETIGKPLPKNINCSAYANL